THACEAHWVFTAHEAEPGRPVHTPPWQSAVLQSALPAHCVPMPPGPPSQMPFTQAREAHCPFFAHAVPEGRPASHAPPSPCDVLSPAVDAGVCVQPKTSAAAAAPRIQYVLMEVMVEFLQRQARSANEG